MLCISTTNIIHCIIMAIVIERKQTAFRLSTSLLNKLREAAERENRSLNNYVESVLMDTVFSNPNKLTLADMKRLCMETENGYVAESECAYGSRGRKPRQR